MDTPTPTSSIEKHPFWKNFPVTSALLLMYLPAIAAGIMFPPYLRPYLRAQCKFAFHDPDLAGMIVGAFELIVIAVYLHLAFGLIAAIYLDKNRLKELRAGKPDTPLAPTLIAMTMLFVVPQIAFVIFAFTQFDSVLHISNPYISPS